MRVRRLAMLSGAAAAIGGALWLKRSRDAEAAEQPAVHLAGSGNGSGPDRSHPEARESEMSG